ncbi:Protein SGS3 [Glycine soja]|uniref:Protein SGS3 n=1 Tax=Glycine soja TaxID=3848 RepID=A0A445IKW3_GLYSO|nr:Protein SGS3 [Glycine soja]
MVEEIVGECLCNGLKQIEGGEKKCLNYELWHACTVPLVSLPTAGTRVVYFPQGHSEQADVETNEVYAQMTLQPLTPWNGMGNQELLDCLCDYAAFKAQHLYGPQGHRGMSALIFEESTAGGKRQLYGYLASKEDLYIFNKHSRGKTKLKFEMRSYQEMVESKIKHINDDSRKLDCYKSMVAKEQIKSQVGTNSLLRISEKLSLTTEENRVDQQHKEWRLAFSNPSSINRVENISCFLKPQDKEMKQFEAEREKIIKIHKEKRLALKKKQWQEQVELEKELENERTQLMDNLELQQETHDLVDSMVERLRTLSRKSDGQFIVVDLRVEMLDKKGCQGRDSEKEKSCFNAQEVAVFLRKIGFEKDTTIYVTQSMWDESLDSLKDLFPKTYTKVKH